jgi:hypothetical protein
MTALGITGHKPPDLNAAPSMFPTEADKSIPPLPDGVHLRWIFGRERGFPKGGYWVFRRYSQPVEVVFSAVTAIANANDSPHHVSGDWGTFTAINPGPLSRGDYVKESRLMDLFSLRGQEVDELVLQGLLLKFDLPAGRLAFRVTLWLDFPSKLQSSSKFIQVKLYSDTARTQLIDQKTIESQANGEVIKVSFTHAAIAAIDFSSGSAVLAALEYELPWPYGKPESNWEHIHPIQILNLPVNHPNYNGEKTDQASSENLAVQRIRYGASAIWQGQPFEQLHNRLLTLVEGGGDGPSMQQIEQKDVKGVDDAGTLKAIKPLDVVSLASLHPAVAQMLGLYLIDTTADKDQEYDYLVLACHQQLFIRDWLSLVNDERNFAPITHPDRFDAWICSRVRLKPHESLPPPEPPKAYALSRPGSLDQVGLHWEKPQISNGTMQPGMPVWQQVYRTVLGEFEQPLPLLSDERFEPFANGLTLPSQSDPNAPLPSPSGWPPTPLPAVDHTIEKEGWYAYKITYIDLFGRYSPLSQPAKWWQWELSPDDLKPWYFREPNTAREIHDFAVEIRAKQLPPAPSHLEALALDPEDPMLLKDEAYQTWHKAWLSVLPRGSKGVYGLRIRWKWTDTQKQQAPHTAEFRIYRKDGRFNCLTGYTKSVRVTDLDLNFAVVETDITPPADVDPRLYARAVLQMGIEVFGLCHRFGHLWPFAV